MKNEIYYSSVIILGFILFLLIYSVPNFKVALHKENTSKNDTETSSYEVIEFDSSTRNLEFESIFNPNIEKQGLIDFEKSIAKKNNKSSFKKLAALEISIDSTLLFYIKDERYLVYLLTKKETYFYSKGTYFIGEDQRRKFFTFNSEAMSIYEGFYRDKNFDYSGSFYDGIYSIKWHSAPKNKLIFEAWRLVKVDNQYYDSFSGQYLKAFS